MVIFHLYMLICVCVNRTIDGDLRVVLDGSSFWADWHHYNYLVFKYIIQVYLRIRIIMARMYNFFHSLYMIDKIIIVFIHSWLVPMVTKFIK